MQNHFGVFRKGDYMRRASSSWLAAASDREPFGLEDKTRPSTRRASKRLELQNLFEVAEATAIVAEASA
jgi:succinate dehydrogenase / fumarate reductase flavoprotein subunit